MMDYKSLIREIPDYPKPGILFYDLTTLWKQADAFKSTLDHFIERYRNRNIQKICSIESRGFILGAPLSYQLNAGCVLIRKPRKLPAAHITQSYDLEYGTDEIGIHEDGIQPGENVLIIDDLLATGGTARASEQLVQRLKGNIVEIAFLVELTFLNGKNNIKSPIFSLIQY